MSFLKKLGETMMDTERKQVEVQISELMRQFDENKCRENMNDWAFLLMLL